MNSKLKEKTIVEKLLIDEIEFESNSDWDNLCSACSSLIKEAGMTDKDIDEIARKVKNGII